MMLSDVCLASVCLSRISGLNREQEDTEVAHVKRDSVTTFKVKRSKVNLQWAGRGHIVTASRTAC